MADTTNVSIFDLLAPPGEVKLARGSLPVRGLSLQEIVGVLSKHKHDYESFFDGETLNALKVASTAPLLLAEVLSMSTGVPIDDFNRVPVGVQVEILEAVWKQTVPDIKKVADLALGVIEALRTARGPKPPVRLSKSS